MILLVVLETNPFRIIPAFSDELKRAKGHKRLLRGTWALETKLSPETWYARLSKHITKPDALLVIQVVGNYDGYLTKSTLEWLALREENNSF